MKISTIDLKKYSSSSKALKSHLVHILLFIDANAETFLYSSIIMDMVQYEKVI